MGENTKIEWCDHSASPWYGCSHASYVGAGGDSVPHQGCLHCYAETMAKRNPGTLGIWGPDGTRVKSRSFIANLRKWNREAEAAGMKCVSIWQPWASLLFSPGQFRKEFETRPLVKRGQNWYPSIVLKPGERVAIQAAKTMAGIEIACEEITREDRHFMAESLLQQFGNIGWDKLPRGCILGTVEIGSTFVVENIKADLSPRERAFGHYGEKRVAIQTLNPIRFAKPIPLRGQQGVFTVDDVMELID